MAVHRDLRDANRSGEQAAGGSTHQRKLGAGRSRDALRIADMDLVGAGLYSKLHLGAAVPHRAGQGELAAAAFRGDILDDGLATVKKYGPVGAGYPVGHV